LSADVSGDVYIKSHVRATLKQAINKQRTVINSNTIAFIKRGSLPNRLIVNSKPKQNTNITKQHYNALPIYPKPKSTDISKTCRCVTSHLKYQCYQIDNYSMKHTRTW